MNVIDIMGFIEKTIKLYLFLNTNIFLISKNVKCLIIV